MLPTLRIACDTKYEYWMRGEIEVVPSRIRAHLADDSRSLNSYGRPLGASHVIEPPIGRFIPVGRSVRWRRTNGEDDRGDCGRIVLH